LFYDSYSFSSYYVTATWLTGSGIPSRICWMNAFPTRRAVYALLLHLFAATATDLFQCCGASAFGSALWLMTRVVLRTRHWTRTSALQAVTTCTNLFCSTSGWRNHSISESLRRPVLTPMLTKLRRSSYWQHNIERSPACRHDVDSFRCWFSWCNRLSFRIASPALSRRLLCELPTHSRWLCLMLIRVGLEW